MTNLVSAYFLALAIIATLLLWGVSLWNGTVHELFATVFRGYFEHGPPLQTKYTGIFLLDFPISLLVTFFFYGTNGSDPGYQLFLIDAYSTLQSAFVWLYIESARMEPKPYLVANPVIWGILWQAFGGAISLPLYFYHHLKWEFARQSRPASGATAALQAIPISFAAGALLPAVVGMLPTWIERSAFAHQRILAAWQPDPVWVSLVQHTLRAILPHKPSRSKSEGVEASERASRATRTAYLTAAVSSAIGHIYVMARILASNSSLVAFSRMYVPNISEGPLFAISKLASGPWLFLQYDLIIISLSSLSWAYLLLIRVNTNSKALTLLTMVFGTCIIGPGATVSLCLLSREESLRHQRQKTTGGKASFRPNRY